MNISKIRRQQSGAESVRSRVPTLDLPTLETTVDSADSSQATDGRTVLGDETNEAPGMKLCLNDVYIEPGDPSTYRIKFTLETDAEDYALMALSLRPMSQHLLMLKSSKVWPILQGLTNVAVEAAMREGSVSFNALHDCTKWEFQWHWKRLVSDFCTAWAKDHAEIEISHLDSLEMGSLLKSRVKRASDGRSWAAVLEHTNVIELPQKSGADGAEVQYSLDFSLSAVAYRGATPRGGLTTDENKHLFVGALPST